MDHRNFWSSILFLFLEWLRGIILCFVPRHFRCKEVKNDIIVITGAGSGIGRLVAQRFHKLGAKLVLWDINTIGLDETAKLLENERVWTYTVDVSERKNVYEAAKKVKDEVGIVTILVNNAGIVIGKSFLDLKDEMIEKTMKVNLMAHFWTTKSFLPDMLATNCGHLVYIASVAGLAGGPRLVDYSASKFANVGMEEAIRMELKDINPNIKSTVVCPWFISTGMFHGVQSDVIPFQEPDHVADEIVLGVLSDQEVLYVPRFMYFLNTLHTILPSRSLYYLSKALGANNAMVTFKGRNN